MNDSDRDMLLSELVDGELATEDANRLLLDIVNDAAGRAALQQHLQLRLALAPWRRYAGGERDTAGDSQPPAVAMVRQRPAWRRVGVLVAAVALVFTAGLLTDWLVKRAERPQRGDPSERMASGSALSAADAARVLAVHESVAGPVGWLAVSAGEVQVHSLRVAAAEGPAVACFLNLRQLGGDSFLQVPDLIICRLDRKAVLNLPAMNGSEHSLRIELVPVRRADELGVQYAVTLDGAGAGVPSTTLTGFIPATGFSQEVGRLARTGTTLDVALKASVLTEEVRG